MLVDAPTGAGPLVVHVGPGGAAHNAGLTAGDRIVDVDGTAVATAAELEAALVARVESHAKTGKTVPMQVVSAAGPHQVAVGLSTGPVIVDLRDDDVLYSVAAFELQSEAQNAESLVPKWVIGLNQGGGVPARWRPAGRDPRPARGEGAGGCAARPRAWPTI